MTKCGLEDFKLRLDLFLTKVPDEPKGEGLVPGATNPFTGRRTNSLVHQKSDQLEYNIDATSIAGGSDTSPSEK